MNFLKELKAKPEIQRQAFYARANQIVGNIKMKLCPKCKVKHPDNIEYCVCGEKLTMKKTTKIDWKVCIALAAIISSIILGFYHSFWCGVFVIEIWIIYFLGLHIQEGINRRRRKNENKTS
jgi:hypothetical protein